MFIEYGILFSSVYCSEVEVVVMMMIVVRHTMHPFLLHVVLDMTFPRLAYLSNHHKPLNAVSPTVSFWRYVFPGLSVLPRTARP